MLVHYSRTPAIRKSTPNSVFLFPLFLHTFPSLLSTIRAFSFTQFIPVQCDGWRLIYPRPRDSPVSLERTGQAIPSAPGHRPPYICHGGQDGPKSVSSSSGRHSPRRHAPTGDDRAAEQQHGGAGEEERAGTSARCNWKRCWRAYLCILSFRGHF